MSSFEWNKIIASVLTAMIVAMASGILAGQLVRPKELEKPVFVVAGAEPSAPAAEGAAAGPEPIGPLLAKADPKKGEQIAKVCAACHTFTKGGPNKIGPNLWDITDEAISWATKALHEQPNWATPLRAAAIANALSDRMVEARAAMACLREVDPALRLGNLDRVAPPLRRAEDRIRLIESLRKAGLPE